MKVVIAMDSFKGSLTSMQAGNAARDGVLAACPDADVIVCPMADGGEGTTDALTEGMGGEKIQLTVTGPSGGKVDAAYGYFAEKKMAVMEMAAAAGITLVETLDPYRATTFGVGEMITDALERGAREFVIGIGGSATNDGGTGMLQALGYRFLGADGQETGQGAQALEKMQTIDDSRRHSLLQEAHFRIACDVKNPLCGENGATFVFGGQKGLKKPEMPVVDAWMKRYAEITETYRKKSDEKCCGGDSDFPGAGAAGGLGFAFLAYLEGELVSGIDLIMDAAGLEKQIADADFVLTGEECLDGQTAMGKVPAGVAKLAKKYFLRKFINKYCRMMSSSL